MAVSVSMEVWKICWQYLLILHIVRETQMAEVMKHEIKPLSMTSKKAYLKR